MSFLSRLVQSIGPEDPVFIQTHDYPDHDAITSAFGLQHLLSGLGVAAEIVYRGEIQRNSLRRTIEELGIIACGRGEGGMGGKDQIVIVDGCKGNRNVTDLAGREIAVIDHHEVASPDDVEFADIRPEYGACATIIHSYYRELDIEIPKNVATALMIGINMDTALLTRSVSKHEILAYADLYTIGNPRLESSILRNYIQVKDLDFYRYALDSLQIEDRTAFCYFADGCNQNLLGILGDFLLSIQEIDFVILCARNPGGVNFSIRCERPERNASLIIQDVLEGIGFGGGHEDLAGGIVRDASLFDERKIFNRFLELLR